MSSRIIEKIVCISIGIVLGLVVGLQLLYSVITNAKKFFFKEERRIVQAVAKPEYGKHGLVYTSSLAVHYVASGTPGKPLILFIHGFPEFWFSWRAQLKEFGSDYYAVAIDNRGYGETTIPSLNSKDYTLDILAQDIKEVVGALGYKSCTLVGHDWGGAVAWHAAITYPECFDKLIIMNAPHPKCFKEYLRSHLSQARKSWYMLFFIVPYLPEIMCSSFNYHFIKQAFLGRLGSLINRTNISMEDIEAYKYVFSRPGRLTAAINYYRAMFLHPVQSMPDDKLKVPTLVIWGEDDQFLEKDLNKTLSLYVDNVTYRGIHASHWVQQDEPAEVNRLMRTFLQS